MNTALHTLSPQSEPLSLRARWVFPVNGPPLENATVETARGRIAAVHRGAGPCMRDLGNVAIVPGLVNAHTHLELSDSPTPLGPARPFTSWLQGVIAHRQTRPAGAAAAASIVAAGRAECGAGGTTTIGDIAGADWPAEAISGSGPRTIAFLEVLGLSLERIDEALSRARQHLDGTGLRGLSPHAPYSVHPDLLRRIVDLASSRGAPVAMHLAETRAELELLSNAKGEFVPFLESLGVWRDGVIPRGSRPLDYLRELARAPRGLAIHGNYLEDEDIDLLTAHPTLSVVYCPRTHAYFGHKPHPWQRLLECGINVALGTDSRASNPDLSLWNELLFLRRLAPEFDPARLLELGTLNGAFALGLADGIGSLEAGKSADLAVVHLPARASADPYSLLFDSESRVVAGWRGAL